MNIVIPMAGLGSRFAKAGFDKPKPFMDVLGKPMVVRV
ncbi:lipopolysaccharide biosynthesis protein, partial [Campylobacter jejuni]